MTEARLGTPDLGIGAGLRVPHYRHIFDTHPEVDFFEIISENFMVEGGSPRHNLARALERYKLVQHGVSLNIGGPDDVDKDYLQRLKNLHQEVQGPWISDHFCWTGHKDALLHDLLPLPANPEVVELVADRAKRVQDFLGVRFALENASSYLAYNSTTMQEWDFVAAVAEKADIGLLLDVNNIYVAAYNHGFDPYVYLNNIPLERVVQIHIAGHDNLGTHIIDVHNGDIIDEVWDLYRYAIEMAGPVSTIIEWDTDVPAFEVLASQMARIRTVRDEAVASREARVRAGGDPRPAQKLGGVPRQTPPDVNRQPHDKRFWAEQGGERQLPEEQLVQS